MKKPNFQEFKKPSKSFDEMKAKIWREADKKREKLYKEYQKANHLITMERMEKIAKINDLYNPSASAE